MHLENSSGESLELRVLGYEYPDVKDDKWDSNWLNIEITVNHKNGTWVTTDPCLLTFEISKIADWFEQLYISTDQVKPKLEFVEPNLVFNLITVGNKFVIRIYFELEVRPPWRPAKTMKKPMKDLWVDFPLDEIDLSKAMHSLRLQLDRFPERKAN